MQDYIEDLLDDVEEFDDDIADDYSDIWVIIANPQALNRFLSFRTRFPSAF